MNGPVPVPSCGSPLDDFLGRLFREGRILFQGRPAPPCSSPETIELLARAYADYRLDVAGPLIPFQARVAEEASLLVMNASWALVDHREPVESLGRRLAMSRPPATPGDHLSADLVLRYLPQLHRRTRVRDRSDPLGPLLETVLRQWPLSGVLAGLDAGPEVPLDFEGHEGLMLLYAERWSRNPTPAWRPGGRTLEYVDLVAETAGRLEPRASSRGGDAHG